MKIDLNHELMALDNKPFLTGETRRVPEVDGEGKPVLDGAGNPVTKVEQVKMTVRFCLVNAYANMGDKLSLSEKVSRGAMATRLHEAERYFEFTPEDIVTAKRLLNEVINHPIVMLRLMEHIDPSAIPRAALAAVPDEAPDR